MNDKIYKSVWPGLNSYTEQESDVFFGRDEEIAQLEARISEAQLCIIYGPSGAGKTSLLRAGVFPRLRRSCLLPIYIRLNYQSGAKTCAQQVFDCVLGTVSTLGLEVRETATQLSAARSETLWEWFHRHIFLDEFKEQIIPVLVFDQFEELFTIGHGELAGEWFTELADLCTNNMPEVVVKDVRAGMRMVLNTGTQEWRVAITLREDFLPRLEECTTAFPVFRKNRIAINALGRRQAREAILRPGKGILTEPVADAILKYIAGESGKIETPLLSLFCSQLDILRQKRGLDGISIDLVESNKTDILANFYDETMGCVSVKARDYLESALLNPNGFRMPLQFDVAVQNGVPRQGLELLIKERILHTIMRDGVQWVEFCHDILTPVARISRESRMQRKRFYKKLHTLKIVAYISVPAVAILSLLSFGLIVQYNLSRKHWERAIANEKIAAQKAKEVSIISAKANQQELLAVRHQKVAERERLISSQAIDFLRSVFEMSDSTHGGREDITVSDIFKANLSKMNKIEPMELRADMQCIAGSFFDNVGEYSLASNLLFSAVTWNVKNRPLDIATAYSLYCLSWWFLDAVDDCRSASSCAYKALKIYDSSMSSNSLDIALVCNGLGVFLSHCGSREEAEAHLNRALEIRCRHLGENHPETAVCHRNLGFLYFQTKRYDLALTAYERSKKILDENHQAESMAMAKTLFVMGQIYRMRHEYENAKLFLNKAIEIYNKRNGNAKSKWICYVYQQLGLTFRDVGKYEMGRKVFLDAIRMAEDVCGKDSELVKDLKRNLVQNDKLMRVGTRMNSNRIAK